MRDEELFGMLRDWLRGLCTCKGQVSSGIHLEACPNANVSAHELDNLYNDIMDWHEDWVDDAVERAMNEV